MAADRHCITLQTIDNDATAAALQGKDLVVKDQLECGNTLARQALEELGPKTVLVHTLRDKTSGRGSGFFTGKDGDLVVTNSHVVADGKQTIVETLSGEVFPTKVIDVDDINDLAVLQVVGIKKDPSRAVVFGDDSKLKNGDPMLAVGHPGGNVAPVVSDGSFIEQKPFALQFQTEHSKRLLEGAAIFGEDNPTYAQDARDKTLASKLGMDTAVWHGSSGGAIVDEHHKVVGVTMAMDDENPYLSLAVPASKVTELLNRKTPKFSFVYEGQSQFDRDPVVTTLADSLTLGGAYALRKYAAPVLGLADGISAYSNLTTAAKNDTYRSPWHYLERGAEGLIGAAGGVMSLIPRTRALGFGLVGAKLLLDVGRDFVPDTYIMKDMTRTNGDTRSPLGWNDVFF